VRGALAFLRRDWDATAERFVTWSLDQGPFLLGAVILMLTVISVAAQIVRGVA
jgi:hypothetical protein